MFSIRPTLVKFLKNIINTYVWTYVWIHFFIVKVLLKCAYNSFKKKRADMDYRVNNQTLYELSKLDKNTKVLMRARMC